MFFLTSNDFDGDIREGHINTSPGIVSYDISYSDAMGYDLVKLKHFDMREIYVGKYCICSPKRIKCVIFQNDPKLNRFEKGKGTHYH